MKQFKIWILFFCAIFYIQAIFSAEPEHLLNKDRQEIKNMMHTYSFSPQNFKDFFKPKMISTATQRGIFFDPFKDETIAHYLANQTTNTPSALALLHAFYEKGETAAIKSYDTHSERYAKFVGCTAFLNLCLQFCKLKSDQLDSFLDLLNKFAERTPAVVIESRIDGKTPAMAIAAINKYNKHRALGILHQHNHQAFEGRMQRNNEFLNIAELIVQSASTEHSKQALLLVINDRKYQHPDIFDNWMHRLKIYTYQNNPSYLRLLENHTPTHISPNVTPVEIAEHFCSCCYQGCNCCIQPGANASHNQYWFYFYSQNPTHLNASVWLMKYQ
ncbi:hypothetical protein KBB68_01525 [Candidatus Babeliales bacterium]|nr:hypothetical protein [Candidatus Babeliales bacterium]